MTSQKGPDWWRKQNYQEDSLTRMLQGEQKRNNRNQQTDTETIQARKAVVETLMSLHPEDELLFLVVELMDRYLEKKKHTNQPQKNLCQKLLLLLRTRWVVNFFGMKTKNVKKSWPSMCFSICCLRRHLKAGRQTFVSLSCISCKLWAGGCHQPRCIILLPSS